MKYTYTVTADVPEGIDAGEPAVQLADVTEIVANANPEWTISEFELHAVDGEVL